MHLTLGAMHLTVGSSQLGLCLPGWQVPIIPTRVGKKLRAMRCAGAGRRSPWKRLVEVVVLVAVTATIWFTVAYCSPCKALPGQVPCSLTDLPILPVLPGTLTIPSSSIDGTFMQLVTLLTIFKAWPRPGGGPFLKWQTMY